MPVAAFGEEDVGVAAELKAETELRESPSTAGVSIGKLPKGTILTLSGERRGDFVAVEVELVDGDVSGWIKASALEVGAEPPSESTTLKARSTSKDKKKEVSKGKPVLPRDESVLLRRELSFMYGVSAGLGYALIDSAFSPFVYSGMGLRVDGYAGFFVDRNASVRLQLGYSSPGGVAEDQSTVSFQMADVAVIAELSLDKFRIFGGAQYSIGLGFGDLPPLYKLEAGSEVSALYGLLGAGYALQVSDVSNVVFRLYYNYALQRDPVGFQNFGLSVALEFQG